MSSSDVSVPFSAIYDGGERGRGRQAGGDASPVSRVQGGAPHHRRRLHGHPRGTCSGPGQDRLELWVVVVVDVQHFVVHVSPPLLLRYQGNILHINGTL